jgi:uncharacterized repeat protein (TIGR03803 family)
MMLSSSTTSAQALAWSYSFDGTYGANPWTSPTLGGSTLYGTTQGGGAYGDGAIYSLPATGGTPTALCSFNMADGSTSDCHLTLVGNTLYGQAGFGGPGGFGTVFSLPTSGGTPNVLASFSYGSTNGWCPDGALTVIGSTIYGAASGDASAGITGTIFSIPTSGGPVTVLASFNGANGSLPRGSLTQIGSALYGTTGYGGPSNDGVIFSVPMSGGAPTVLAAFNGANGALPYNGASLTRVGSTLYGATAEGGAYGGGTVFSVPLTGGPITDLCSFNGPNDGGPWGSLTLSPDGSTLYGMTMQGGLYGDGSIFSIPVSGGTPTTLFSFDGTNGQSPWSELTLSPDGSTLYGTTSGGGASGDGTAFALNLNPVPEPSTIVLLGIASVSVLAYAWRKRTRTA